MQEKSTKTAPKKADRRQFLTMAGLGVAATGAAAALAGKEAKADAARGEQGRKGAGYQETEHVKRYYELARF